MHHTHQSAQPYKSQNDTKTNKNQVFKWEDRNELLVKQYDYYNDEGNFHKTRSKRSYDRAEEIREIYYKLNQEDIKILKKKYKDF